jgi:uncharacterized protein YpbB
MYMGFPLTWTRGGEDKGINGGKLSEFDNFILPNYLTKLYQHIKLNMQFCNNKNNHMSLPCGFFFYPCSQKCNKSKIVCCFKTITNKYITCMEIQSRLAWKLNENFCMHH